MIDEAEIHRMANSANVEERRKAAELLHNFAAISDKNMAWDDLHGLISDNDFYVKQRAVDALGGAFSHVYDKEQAWADLHKLTQDKNKRIRENALDIFIYAFYYVPNKYKAYEDLHGLIIDPDNYVRWAAAEALGSVFSHVPDKKLAWDDLHRLTSDNNSGVRRGAAKALSNAFSHVPDKKLAWDDLIRLTLDKDEDVRADAYPSSGKVCIFKASEAESESVFKKEMENAIEFFEKASKESIYNNPAKFCLPFYRSFHTLIFKKEEAEAEVQRYLSEAKRALKGSKSKEKLLEAIENMSNALKEAQKTQDINDMKSVLNSSKRCLDRACELLDTTEDNAPGASRLIRKGLPIIDERIKEIIAEIQEKAKEACRESQGTPTEEIACAVNQEIQKWNISDQDDMTQNVENMIFCLKSLVPKISANNDLHGKIEEIRLESDVVKQYTMLLMFIPLISTISPKKQLSDIFDSSSTHAAFIGFLIAEFGMIFYPIPNIHIISAVVAVYVFFIVAILKSIKKE